MKLYFGIVFCILFCFGSDSKAQTGSDIDSISQYELKSFLRNSHRSQSYFNYENVDVFYTRCEWEVDPSFNAISGNVTSYFSSDSILDSLAFDCSRYLSVDSIIYHSSQITYNRVDDLLKVIFPSSIPSPSNDSLTIFYHGTPTSSGNGSFEVGSHSGVPSLWTLSEPYGAKDWWPCRQNTADKIDSIDVYCKIPFGNKCASNGKLISVDTSNAKLIYHWKSNYPIAPYLVAIAVTNYSEFSDSVVLSNSDTLQILNYVYPEQIGNTQPALSVTPSLIQFYDSLLITYPFSKEKYGHAQFGWGGGMEHQTMSFVGSFGFELIAHELVHQWFGDEITCQSWADIWLHEGFATYLAGMAIERFKPEEFYSWKYSALQDIVSSPGGSVICNDTTDLSRIFNGRLSYRKGAYVLSMLRWKFGNELFALSLRDYLSKATLKYNYATTDDLKTSFENVTASDLTQFFDEWVYGEGFPVYNIEWSRKENSVDLFVNQNSSNPNIPFFHIPLPIQIGNSATDTIVIAEASYSGQQFHFDLNFKPDYISIDPDLKLISGNNKVRENLPPGSIDDLIAIFPNPSNGHFEVFAKTNSLKMDSFSVIDYCGKMVYSQSFKVGFKETIDLSGLPSGIYIVEVETDLGPFHQKIILIN